MDRRSLGARVGILIGLATLACAEEAPSSLEPAELDTEAEAEAEVTAEATEETVTPVLSEDPLEVIDRAEPVVAVEGDGSGDFAPPPDGAAAPPDRAAFEARWSRWLRLDEVAPVPDREDVVEYRATALARRGSVRVALYTSWPRLFPEERTVDFCARGATRRLDARPHRVEVCEGDRVSFRVPVASPAPEWTDALVGQDPRPEDTSRPLVAIPTAQLPGAVRALSPELGDARTRATSDMLRVTYWMRAEQPGAVALALPLHFPSPAVRVLERGAVLTERVAFVGDGWLSPPARELRPGDAIAIGHLRP